MNLLLQQKHKSQGTGLGLFMSKNDCRKSLEGTLSHKNKKWFNFYNNNLNEKGKNARYKKKKKNFNSWRWKRLAQLLKEQ